MITNFWSPSRLQTNFWSIRCVHAKESSLTGRVMHAGGCHRCREFRNFVVGRVYRYSVLYAEVGASARCED